jgi:hypothetical protein
MKGEWYAIIGLGLLSVGAFALVFSGILRVARRHGNRIDLATRADWLEILGLFLAAAGVSVFACLALGRGMVWIFEVPMKLAVGWVAYLNRIERQIEPDLMHVTSAGVCLAATAVVAHLFLRWLAATASRPWPPKRTFQVLVLVVLMFASGLAVTGLVQQTSWLIRTPEPLVKDARSIS